MVITKGWREEIARLDEKAIINLTTVLYSM